MNALLVFLYSAEKELTFDCIMLASYIITVEKFKFEESGQGLMRHPNSWLDFLLNVRVK